MQPFIVILGAAESGIGAALLAIKQGADVFVSEKGEIKEKYKQILIEKNIPFEENNHNEEKILKASEVIKSPGISAKVPIIQKIKSKGIPVISEIEYGARYTKSPIIAITGTNGKSTTTTLTHHILTKAGLDAALVGNIGYSFARQVAERDASFYVMEISSFQLEDCFEFHPHIAMLLNVTENHLDRYNYKMEGYAEAKFRITQNLAPNDYFIYGADSFYLTYMLFQQNISAKKLPFSLERKILEGAYANNEKLFINQNQNTITMNLNQLSLRGKHNVYNSMAAGLAATSLGLKEGVIRESMSDFHSLEHRLEEAGHKKGILYINDSKATNVNSVWYALESMEQPVIWIAGGVDKGNDYSKITDLVREKVKAIVCLGKDNRKIHEAFSKSVDLIVNTESMEDAIAAAQHFATEGDVVLLSPACASFDLFENYEERGQRFKQVVNSLPE